MIRQSTSRNGDSKVSSATSAFLRFNLCFETFDTPIRRQSVKLPQMSNKPIELDLPERLFLIGKGSLKAGSQAALKIEVWSYMDRSGCRESYLSVMGISRRFCPSRRHPSLGAGRQRIIGQPSVDVVGSGWSEGKRMSVRVTRKVGHPCRLWEFGWDLPYSGNTGEEVW